MDSGWQDRFTPEEWTFIKQRIDDAASKMGVRGPYRVAYMAGARIEDGEYPIVIQQSSAKGARELGVRFATHGDEGVDGLLFAERS